MWTAGFAALNYWAVWKWRDACELVRWIPTARRLYRELDVDVTFVEQTLAMKGASGSRCNHNLKTPTLTGGAKKEWDRLAGALI